MEFKRYERIEERLFNKMLLIFYKRLRAVDELGLGFDPTYTPFLEVPLDKLTIQFLDFFKRLCGLFL